MNETVETHLRLAPLPPRGVPDESAVYRTVGGVTLQAHLFRPAGAGCGTAIAFFFGGGWISDHD